MSEVRNKTLTATIRCESVSSDTYLFIYFFQTSSTTAFLFNLFAYLCGFRLMDYIVFFMAVRLAEACICVFALSF